MSVTSKTFLVMAGGTGGHIFPALAVARELIGRGHKVVWLGSIRGLENQIIPAEDISLHTLSVGGLRGKGWKSWLLAPFNLCLAVAQALRVLKTVKPDCVLGMGGFASGPGGLAAWLLRKPIVIHEQNAVAGMTNATLSRFAAQTLEAFPGAFAKKQVKLNRAPLVTGNPIRNSIVTIPTPENRSLAEGEVLNLLVVGGSLGAAAINAVVPKALALLEESIRPVVLHQCGKGKDQATRQAYEGMEGDIRVEPFITDMKAALEWADLVVCRSGAMTVSEIAMAGVGSIFIPYPHAVDDHQTANADYLVARGAAYCFQETELSPELLAEKLQRFHLDRERVKEMAIAARKSAHPEATEKVMNICLEACGE
ncbi:MAG: undecaprenyldiphospho-muramoylpentapeptide beta-N-acetylglucosaminyltransferase [Pseudomonadales bacterium]|nr:undecaprenyldiphospho-muramoylpentapeptide beta-N-acetylglucosaminyltransferase [Pseudomonadales bacterium]